MRIMTPARLILTCILVLVFCLGADYISQHYPDFDKFLETLPGGIAFIWAAVVLFLVGGFFLIKEGSTEVSYPAWTVYLGIVLVAIALALYYYVKHRLPMDTGAM